MKKRDLGIKQKEDYNGYMKAYQRLYYREHQIEWRDYLAKRRYRAYTLDRLNELLEHKIDCNCTMPEEKRERLIKILKEIIAEKERANYKPKDGTLEIRDALEDLNREVRI